MTPFERTWRKRFAAYNAGQPIEKSKIGALCRIMTVPEKWTKTDHAALQSVREIVWDASIAWAITPEQTAQGLKWLNRREVLKQLTPTQAEVLRTFTHFTFRGVDEVESGWRSYGYPVYRVHGNSGWFDYRPMPWQAGGPSFEVLKQSH